MRIEFSRIKSGRLRRILMAASLPLVVPYGLLAGAWYGISYSMHMLFKSYRRVWLAGTPAELPLAHAEVGVAGANLCIIIPLELLAYATEQGPWTYEVTDPLEEKPEERLRITNTVQWGQSVARQIGAERGEAGASMLHSMVDEAIREAIEAADPGFVWPANGIDAVPDLAGA